MNYINYIRYILYGFLVGLVLFLLAILFQIGAPTESSRWTYEIYQIKTSIANSIKTPKLVIIAGSNAHFGISCKMIVTETGVPCVNGGTHAGLGIDYILTRSRLWLKPGDLVLLPLEYGLYQDIGIPNDVTIDYIFSRDPSYLLSLDLISKLRFFLGMSFERLQQGITGKFKPAQPLTIGYQSNTLNEYGDETMNRQANMTEKEYQMIDNQGIEIALNKPSNYSIAKVRDFIKWCQDNNIKVIATWPNTGWVNASNEKVKQKLIQNIQLFYTNFNVKILGKPEEFIYERSMLFDTNYHLNDIGVRDRTQKIIELLKPDLEQLKYNSRELDKAKNRENA